MAHVVVGSITHGTPRVGIWCDHCALPSVLEFDLLIVNDDGVSPIGVYRFCPDCGDGL